MPPRLHLQNVERNSEDTGSSHADPGIVSTKRKKWNSGSYRPSRLIQHTSGPKNADLGIVIERVKGRVACSLFSLVRE